MAGKVKKKDDGAQSKTARASMRGGSTKETYNASPDVARIVPLGGGTGAYVLDPRDGRTVRLTLGTEKFFDVLTALADAGHADRLRRDLSDLVGRYPESNWKEASVRFEALLLERSEGNAA